MSERHIPVRPNLDQLKHQAKDLLREMRAADPTVKLAHAQHALAKSYGIQSWARLMQACRVVEAIWNDDADALRALVLKHPHLLHEMARGTKTCNWGPPMSYAANLGRDRIIAMLRDMGAEDIQHAFNRACLQGQLDTARLLFDMGARPVPGAVMGPAETLSASGLKFLLDLGTPISDAAGSRLAPVGLVFETYCRNPQGKHGCLELFAQHGVELPDTPTMAVHRGRIDLLEKHLERDPAILSRTFSHAELFPPEVGCNTNPLAALGGTPISGGTLLHLCVDVGEFEIARWLIERGIDVNARAAVDADGFGGHTALFVCVVSQMYACGWRDVSFARLLLEHGANTAIRASIRKQLFGAADERVHDYYNVTALEFGRRFHDQGFVNPAVLKLLESTASAQE